MKWLKHAFAIEKPSDLAPTDEQKEIVDRLCRWMVRKHLTTPGLIMLEISRPLNYIGAHVMHFFRPAVSALLDTREYHAFALFLEHRGAVDYICRRMEQLEAEMTREEESRESAPQQPSDTLPGPMP